MSELDEIKTQLALLMAKADLADELAGTGCTAKPTSWRIEDENGWGVGEVRKNGRSWSVFSYQDMEESRYAEDMESLKDCVNWLRFKDRCRCRYRPLWNYRSNCKCGAREELGI